MKRIVRTPSFAILFLSAAVIGHPQAAKSQIFTVAPDGKGADCRPSRPCTLDRAQEKVRALAPKMRSDLIISLVAGTYRLTSTLMLSASDSGRNGYQIIYEGPQAGSARLSGGIVADKCHHRGDGLVSISVPHRSQFRQIYVAGSRAIRSRAPNDGTYLRDVRWDRDSLTVSVAQLDPAAMEFGTTEFVVNRHWQQHRLRIVAATKTADGRTTLRFDAGDAYRSFNAGGGTIDENSSYFLENSRSFLDRSGEWYFDQIASEVLYRPLTNNAKCRVTLPILETLIRLQGAPDAPVHNVVFRNIIFEETGWTEPSRDGFGQVQAVWLTSLDGSRFMPAGVEVRGAGAHHITFENNVFRNMGSSGLAFFDAATDNRVIGNQFYDLAGGGLAIDAAPERYNVSGLGSRRFEVRDNQIFRVGSDYTGSVGIFLGYVADSTVEHNELYNLPYSAISIGWGWTNKENPSKKNLIRANHIHHVMQIHDDGGAIYLLSQQSGTVISANYIHDVRRGAFAGSYAIAGIYLDNGAGGVTIRDNVIDGLENPVHQNLGNDPQKGIVPAAGNLIEDNQGRSLTVINDAGPLKIRSMSSVH